MNICNSVLAGSEHLRFSVSGFVFPPGVAEEKSEIYMQMHNK